MDAASGTPIGNDSMEVNRPIGLGGSILGAQRHICAFINSLDDLIGGILQENPFFVPPDQFLRELREGRGA